MSDSDKRFEKGREFNILVVGDNEVTIDFIKRAAKVKKTMLWEDIVAVSEGILVVNGRETSCTNPCRITTYSECTYIVCEEYESVRDAWLYAREISV